MKIYHSSYKEPQLSYRNFHCSPLKPKAMKSLLKTHFLPFNLHCPKSSTQTMADRTLIGLIVLLGLMSPAKILGQDTSMTFTVNVIGYEGDPNAGMPGHKRDPPVPGDQSPLRVPE